MVIPAYQAEATIGPLVQQIRSLGLKALVVDDASTDETARRAEQAGADVLLRPANGGKGAALRQGLAAAGRMGCGWVMTLDADGQHLASEIRLFLAEAERAGLDLILGNRMGDPRGMPWDRRLTNRFMSWLISLQAGQPIPDTQCGFRLLSRRLLESVELASDRFEIESEMVIRAAWAGLRIGSVPVSSVYRRQMSFIRPVRDTLRFIRMLRRLQRERPPARRPA